MDDLEKIKQVIAQILDEKNPCTEHEILSNLKEDEISPFAQLNLKHSRD